MIVLAIAYAAYDTAMKCPRCGFKIPRILSPEQKRKARIRAQKWRDNQKKKRK
jgi:hypothetical protein